MKKLLKKITFPDVVSLLMCMAALTVAYPFYAFLLRVPAELPFEDYMLSYLLLTEGVGLLAYAAAGISTAVLKKQWQCKVLKTVLLLAVLAGTIVVNLRVIRVDVALTVVSAIFTLVMYWFAYGLYEKEMQKSVFAIETVVFILPPVVFRILHYEYDPAPFLLMYLAMAGIFAVSENNTNLDYVMRRRGHSMTQMPSKIRYFNLILLLILFLVVAVLVLFRGAVTGFVTGFLFSAARALNTAIVWIKSLFPASSGETMDVSKPFEEMPNFVQEQASEGNPFFIYVLSICIVVVILLVFGKSIRRGLTKLFRKLVEWVRQWLGRSVNGRKNGEDANEYYTDRDETIDEDGGSRRLNRGRELRLWKKELRQFEKMEDGKEKFLFGYALSVRGLALCGIPVTQDMTALELLEESRSVFSGKAYDVATQCSNALRFGRVPVPPETKQLQESLNEIRSCKKAK